MKPLLHETVLREYCKSSPSAAQALDELLSRLTTFAIISEERDELRLLAEAIIDDETDREKLIEKAKQILGYS
jgi:hypothetical protein